MPAVSTPRVRPLTLVLVLSLPILSLAAQKFYPDDPLEKEPPPTQVGKVKHRALSDYYDLLENTFFVRGERNTRSRFVRAKSANTLGEVPDSAWYTCGVPHCQDHFWVKIS